jgi:hypothetical protein
MARLLGKDTPPAGFCRAQWVVWLLEPLTCAALGTRSALEGPSILPSGGGDAVARRRRRVSPQQRQLVAARAPQGHGRGQVRPGQPAGPDLACQWHVRHNDAGKLRSALLRFLVPVPSIGSKSGLHAADSEMRQVGCHGSRIRGYEAQAAPWHAHSPNVKLQQPIGACFSCPCHCDWPGRHGAFRAMVGLGRRCLGGSQSCLAAVTMALDFDSLICLT